MTIASTRTFRLAGAAFAVAGLLRAPGAGAVCNLERLQQLDALDAVIEITGVQPQVVAPGEDVVLTGYGFSLVPASELYVTFASRTPSYHAQTHCPRPGTFRFRHDRAPNLRVISDNEIRVTAPPGVRDHGLGPGEVRLVAVAGPCAASTPTLGPYTFVETKIVGKHAFAGVAEPSPSAPAIRGFTIYLDFDGHTAAFYPRGGENGVVQTITVAPFRGGAALREEIRTRVAEHYSPFDVRVVTREPANLADGPGVGIRVAIGGTTADLAAPGGEPVAGLSTDPGLDPTVLVAERFRDGLPRAARDVAKTVSHEVAHALGFLIRQPLVHYGPAHADPTGWRDRILQQGEVSARATWWAGFDLDRGVDLCTNTAQYGPQEDLATLLSALGARPDDHGDTPADATPLVRHEEEDELTGEGVITMNAASWPQCAPAPCPGGSTPAAEDRDFFVFSTGPARFHVRVDTLDQIAGLEAAATLDAELELWHLAPEGWTPVTSVAREHTASDLWAEITHQGRAGLYAVGVVSHGDYGDLGRYRVRAWGDSVSVVSTLTGGLPSYRLWEAQLDGPTVTLEAQPALAPLAPRTTFTVRTR